MFRIDRINRAEIHKEFAPDPSANIDTHFPARGRSILDGIEVCVVQRFPGR
jgi:hypothetical protein